MNEANSGKGIKTAFGVMGVLILGGVVYYMVSKPPSSPEGSVSTSEMSSATHSSGEQSAAQNTANSAASGNTAQAAVTPFEPHPFAPVTQLQTQDLKLGAGAEATPGKMVTVHYTGWLSTGQKFDSSKDRGQPFPFPLGAGRVIKGWDQGVAGMKVGGIRRLTIPPDLAYGEHGMGGAIPMNASLQFDVELLSVE